MKPFALRPSNPRLVVAFDASQLRTLRFEYNRAHSAKTSAFDPHGSSSKNVSVHYIMFVVEMHPHSDDPESALRIPKHFARPRFSCYCRRHYILFVVEMHPHSDDPESASRIPKHFARPRSSCYCRRHYILFVAEMHPDS